MTGATDPAKGLDVHEARSDFYTAQNVASFLIESLSKVEATSGDADYRLPDLIEHVGAATLDALRKADTLQEAMDYRISDLEAQAGGTTTT